MAEMRDIRPDLKMRMDLAKQKADQVRAEYERHKKLLEDEYQRAHKAAVDEWEGIKVLLDLEERRHGNASSPSPPRPAPSLHLADFFVRKVNERPAGIPKDDLRRLAEAEGYFEEGGGGRATHTTLLNITKTGRIREIADGVYGPAPEPPMTKMLNGEGQPALSG